MRFFLPILLFSLIIPCGLKCQWAQCGGPGGGPTDFVAQNPVTKTIFAGSNVAGLFRLKPNSNKWESLQYKLNSAKVKEVDAVNNFVFVVLSTGLYSSTVYSSADDGDTWVRRDTGKLSGGYTLCANDSILVICGNNSYCTKDGINFTYIQTTPPANAFNPNPYPYYVSQIIGNRLFATTYDPYGDLVFAYSDNFGQSWSTVISILASDCGINPSISNIIQYNDSLYVFTHGVFSNMYVSNDNGATWVPEECSNQPFCNYPYNQLIESTYGLLDAGPQGLSYFDGGWNMINENGLYLKSPQFICNTQNDLYISCNEDSIIYKSADEGLSWQKAFTAEVVSDMVNDGNAINVYCGYNYNYYYSENGETVLTGALNPSNLLYVSGAKSLDNRIYALVNSFYPMTGAICQSNDNGQTWNTLQSLATLSNATYTCYFSGLAVDSQAIIAIVSYRDNITGLYMYNDIIYSHDGGLTFHRQNSPDQFSNGMSQCSLLGNNAFAISGSSFYKSSDGGVNWLQKNLVSDTLMSILTVTPNFVIMGTNTGKIWFSTDTGNTFADITGNFPATVTQFYFLGTNLYALTPYSGIWKTDATQLGMLKTQLISNASQVDLFPNPARNSISVTLKPNVVYSNLGYKIYNDLGQLIANGTATIEEGTFSLSTATLLKGVYYLQLQNINGNKGIKFVID